MKPYHKLLVTIVLLDLPFAAFAQKTSDTVWVNLIKTQYAEINKNLKSYRKVTKTDTTETTEGNEVLLYYSGNEIKKVSATYYGEAGKALNEFYFFNNKLIFCYCVDYRYEAPIYSQKSKVKIASTTEERLYLHDGKIFLVKKRPSHSEYFSEFPNAPEKEAKRLIDLKDSHKN